jgi:hypothetical protein
MQAGRLRSQGFTLKREHIRIWYVTTIQASGALQ